MQTPKHSSRARRGLSLVEATISMVIVSVVIAGALRVHAAASTNALAATRALQGRSLARTLLDEIRQCRYEEPEADVTPAFGLEGEATANRSTWDDVDDYHGFSESGGGNLTGKTGTEIEGTAGWAWSASVKWVSPVDTTLTSVTETGLKRITVMATSPSGETTVVRALRSANGLVDQASYASDTDVVTFVDLEVRLEDGSSPRRMGIATLGRPRN